MTNFVTDAWDPLHKPGRPETHWSTVNVGEALPGVATPLGWSIWSDIGDQMCRDLSYTIGVFNAEERRQPLPGPDRIITAFFGRIAMRTEWLVVTVVSSSGVMRHVRECVCRGGRGDGGRR